MAGGTGSRFWPYSRNSKPKQFLDVLGTGKTLIRMTFERFLKLASEDKIYVVTNQQYVHLVKEQLPELSNDQILAEPSKKNTAPCIAYATYKLSTKNPEAIQVITPADHAIFDEEMFYHAIRTAIEGARANDRLITIGIKPSRPETGYGYIQHYDEADAIKKVKTFTEKPELSLAEKFLESGDFVWNSGIFIWKIENIIKAFNKYLPDASDLFAAGKDSYYTEKEVDFINNVYTHCRSISIDYAIMEKADNVYVVQGDFGWSDLGSWGSLHELLDKDENDNVIQGDVLLYNCKNNFIKLSENKHLLAQDLEGYLIADFNDILVICKKDHEAKFRGFVSDIKEQKGDKLI